MRDAEGGFHIAQNGFGLGCHHRQGCFAAAKPNPMISIPSREVTGYAKMIRVTVISANQVAMPTFKERCGS